MKNITAKKPNFDLTRSGHTFAAIGQEFPLELMHKDPRTALITLALLFSNSSPMRCDNYGLATSQLAMLAAAPFADIDIKHYNYLRAAVAEYCDYCAQLQKQPESSMQNPPSNIPNSIDQADGFASDLRLQQNVLNADAELNSDYERMVQMLNFILAAAACAIELEQVKRSVQKQ